MWRLLGLFLLLLVPSACLTEDATYPHKAGWKNPPMPYNLPRGETQAVRL